MSNAPDTDAETRLKTVFAEVFGISENSISPETSPENLDEWDSFGHMRLVMAIEKEFELSLSMEQISGLDSFASLEQTVLGEH